MNNPRVLFIEPHGAPSNVFAKFMTIPLLGPLYLGTIAKQAGFDVEILNENILRRDVSDAELEQADILCLSCITATVNHGKKIAQRYRNIRAAKKQPSKTIIGGIHASMIPQDVSSDFDHVVVGEAEHIITDILSGTIKEPIIYGEPVKDLDSLPIPDFTLLKNSSTMGIRPVMTSRGCPYDCNFCSVTEMFGRGYRSQTPERIFREIKDIRTHWVFFTDDHFAANTRRTDALLDIMIKNNFPRPWNAQVRTEITRKPEFVAKMRKAGCRNVYVGFESINPESLENMNKRQSVEDISRSISVFKKNSINVHGMFMLGNDPDTKETFKVTADFCKKSGIDYVQYTILTPLPGTRLYKQLEQEGRLLHKDWTYYDALHVVFKPKHMSPRELQKGMIDTFRDFYSYTRMLNEAINSAAHASRTVLQALHKKVYFPSIRPLKYKIAGRIILNAWVSKNGSYLDYLGGLT